MKIGLGLPGGTIDERRLRFARQIGATHIVAHLVSAPSGHPLEARGYRVSEPNARAFSKAGLAELKAQVEARGLRLEAIENFAPADWYDVLLDGPRRDEQMETVARVIRSLGDLEIPTMGYNFSVAGVWGRGAVPEARGEAETVAYRDPEQPPIPLGMVWNMVYDPDGFDPDDPTRVLEPISIDEHWRRHDRFLDEMLPVAEAAGVTLALHPDDPPLATLRGTGRLVHRPEHYGRLADRHPSPRWGFEFCIGTLAEMPGSRILDVVDRYSRTGRIAYVHFRNVVGVVPSYKEVFVDEGDTDMLEAVRILQRNGYRGVLIPDHTPLVDCDAPWHAGVAFALGWMRAALRSIDALDDSP
jgi:mannonate dehydratase